MSQLVVDLSAQDNLNQACSELPLLLPLCHRDDQLLVGLAPCGPDHRGMDEQVSCDVGAAGLLTADTSPRLPLSSMAMWAGPLWTTTPSACVTAAVRFLLP